MKYLRLNHTQAVSLMIVFILGVTGCKSDPKKNRMTTEMEPEAVSVIEVVTNSMEFIVADTIASGWNTFAYTNNSTEPHFILLDKYPAGKTIQNTISEVGPAFDAGMSFIMEGKTEEAMQAFGKLPEWFSNIVFTGGTGLISPGKTALTTVNLPAGYYVMECYVRMPDGSFHSSMGMTKELIVDEEMNTPQVPEATMALTISSTEGITFTGVPSPGHNVFSVYYADQVAHENFVGHDVNLVQMEEGADLEALEAWINWATPEGLMSSTLPEGFTFLGGTNDGPEGTTQYFEVTLTPGSYAFIAEVPNASEKGMLQPFEVVVE